jgi:hypothetical protein
LDFFIHLFAFLLLRKGQIVNKKLIVLALLSAVSIAAIAQSSGVPVTGAGAAANSQTSSGATGGSLLYSPTESSTVRYAASSAFGPALTSSNDTCMGSSSLGASGMSFGVAVGSTWTDKNCQMLKNSRELWNQGNHAAALALLCSDEDINYAISVSGGVLDRRQDGAVIHRGCPMTKAEWISKGKPLLDPVTGQQFTTAQIDPPQRIAYVAPVPVTSIDAQGIKMTVTPIAAADSSASK